MLELLSRTLQAHSVKHEAEWRYLCEEFFVDKWFTFDLVDHSTMDAVTFNLLCLNALNTGQMITDGNRFAWVSPKQEPSN